MSTRNIKIVIKKKKSVCKSTNTIATRQCHCASIYSFARKSKNWWGHSFWRHEGFSYTISLISYRTTSCVWVSTSYTSLLLVYPLWLPFMLPQWLHLPVFGDTVCLLTTFLGGNLKTTQNNDIINIIIIIIIITIISYTCYTKSKCKLWSVAWESDWAKHLSGLVILNS